jgi:hypothetical protein
MPQHARVTTLVEQVAVGEQVRRVGLDDIVAFFWRCGYYTRFSKVWTAAESSRRTSHKRARTSMSWFACTTTFLVVVLDRPLQSAGHATTQLINAVNGSMVTQV